MNLANFTKLAHETDATCGAKGNGADVDSGNASVGPKGKPPWKPMSLAEIKTRAVEWLIENWLARAFISVLDGDPGVGKSLILAWIAAFLTALGFRVIYFTSEDPEDSMLKPRLIAAGVPDENPQIVPIDDNVKLPEHLPWLMKYVDDFKADFVIMDQMFTYLTVRNMNDAHEVRKALQEIAAAIKRANVGLFTSRHLRKTQAGAAEANALYMGLGSI